MKHRNAKAIIIIDVVVAIIISYRFIFLMNISDTMRINVYFG